MSVILKSWFGDGGNPVARPIAERRADICVLCNLNTDPLWWEKMVKNPIADAIKHAIAAKNQMNLSLPQDNVLAMCKNCGCCNRLHVWTPIEHIIGHTSPETMDKFPDHCWIKQEKNLCQASLQPEK